MTGENKISSLSILLVFLSNKKKDIGVWRGLVNLSLFYFRHLLGLHVYLISPWIIVIRKLKSKCLTCIVVLLEMNTNNPLQVRGVHEALSRVDCVMCFDSGSWTPFLTSLCVMGTVE